MSNIYARKNQNGLVKYYGNITIDGIRTRKCLGLTKETAELALKKLEYYLLFNKQVVEKCKEPIQAATISFMSNLELRKIGTRQLKTIHGKLRALIKYCKTESILYVDDFTTNNAHEFIKERSNHRVINKYHAKYDKYAPKLSISTLNKDIQTMKRFFNHCIEMNWMTLNPFNTIRSFNKPNKQRYYFTPEQIKLIMSNAGIFHDFYYLLLHTGIRSTDAFKLRPKHIDGKYLKLQMNKTGDILCIPIPKYVLDVLEDKLDNYNIFPSVQSNTQRRNCVKNIQRLFDYDFVRKNNINLHTFRHTYAHNMLDKGVPKEVLQTLLGHRSIKTTEIYANWVNKESLIKWIK